mmetsp:Transcript_18736/g.53890  ORF Transcript_18736/g.53890 Transcript_18736/m.53890 type:complete len:475 (-) Transcript_18736:229-1653(-)|eukprot:CAMPEP_0181042302 /NCGR_PEP_ID=MMETSP1070-20121207/12077_1 /TAXON_ID=265543 /ORGANISM="Minutocellus polymorphus, Strain NH13" /LENGTH=474 /DNA_ID=CAMNT_0023120505 /DNA_START=91 /DNA_END=1515 /DNA_ORIENTATION=+
MSHSDAYKYEEVATTIRPDDADAEDNAEDNDDGRVRRRKRARPMSDSHDMANSFSTARPITCLAVGICVGLVISLGLLLGADDEQRNVASVSASLHPPITSHSSSRDGFEDDVDVDVERYCRNRPRKECPPISKFVKGYKVRGNIEWLLDFAVVGSAKAGTSFLLRYLGNSSETLMPKYEVCKMSKNRPDELVKLYYNASLVAGKYHRDSSSATPVNSIADDADLSPTKMINGLKCPKSLGTEFAVSNFEKYFPNLKYIVTMRHPVKWFQSFYNYRVYGNGKLPPPRELIGSCVADSPYICSKRCAVKTHTQNVCTDRAKFHHQLSRFGKTPMNSKEENDLLVHDMDIVPSNGTVFLMDIAQLFPSEKASRHLARDLSNYLGLRQQLPSLKDVPPDSSRYTDPERTKYFINICDDEHRYLREVLVGIGTDAYTWIRDYFLGSRDVVVSSREDFLELISKWQYDPCADGDYNNKL